MSSIADIEWRISDTLIEYPEALKVMEERVTAIHAGTAPEMVWLLEHPPLYTAGTSANPSDLVDPDRFPVYDAGRGGQYTYHGPGQRVAYFMLNLTKRGKDVRKFVYGLEEVMIRTLEKMGVTAERREGRVGVWVARGGGREDKIGAIGVRIKKWVTFHGISLNVEPDLTHFDGIVPCGISEHGVTSLYDLGLPVTMDDVDVLLKETVDEIFGLETREMAFSIAEKKSETSLPYEAMPTSEAPSPQGVDLTKTHPVFKL